jgi:hypothetical protein
MSHDRYECVLVQVVTLDGQDGAVGNVVRTGDIGQFQFMICHRECRIKQLKQFSLGVRYGVRFDV